MSRRMESGSRIHASGFICLYACMIIIPSILVTSENEFKSQIKAIDGLVEMIQIDLADGKFAPNTTWTFADPEHAQKYLNDIDFELHLMVESPLDTIKKWSDHPRLKRLLIHFESTKNIEAVIEEIKLLNKEVGIVLNPDTSIYEVEPYLDRINSVMLMGVYPGFQGQKFIDNTIERIKKLREISNGIFIEVDGGVNNGTIKKIVKAGADAVCPGSAIFGGGSIKENIKGLKSLIK